MRKIPLSNAGWVYLPKHAAHGVIIVEENRVSFSLGDERQLSGANPRESGQLWQEIAEAARWLGERGAKSLEVIDGRDTR